MYRLNDDKQVYTLSLDAIDIELLQLHGSHVRHRPPQVWDLKNLYTRTANEYYEFEISTENRSDSDEDSEPSNEESDDIDDNIDLETYVQMVNLLKKTDMFSINVCGGQVLIKTVSGARVSVPGDHFLGLARSRSQCLVCRRAVTDAPAHALTARHMTRLAAILTDQHCIRQIDKILNHCILCNDIIENPEIHTIGSEHTKNLNKALNDYKFKTFDVRKNDQNVSYANILKLDVNEVITAETFDVKKNNQNVSYANILELDVNEVITAETKDSNSHRQLPKKDKSCVKSVWYRCEVCDVKITNNFKHIDDHESGSRHKMALKSILVNDLKENDELAEEGNEVTNDNQVIDNNYLQITPNITEVAVFGETLQNEAKQNRKRNSSSPNKSVDEVEKSDSIMTQENIVSDITSEYFCNICNVSVPNKDQNIKEHINGSKHLKKVNELNKDNIRSVDQVSESLNSTDISVSSVLIDENTRKVFKPDDLNADDDNTMEIKPVLPDTKHANISDTKIGLFVCNICNVVFPNRDVCINDHVNGSKINMKLSKLNEDNITSAGKDPETDRQNRQNFSYANILKLDNANKVIVKAETEDSNSHRKLPKKDKLCVKSVWYHCEVCDVKITKNFKHIEDHESGSRHKMALKSILENDLKENYELAEEGNEVTNDNQVIDNNYLQITPNITDVDGLGETLQNEAKQNRKRNSSSPNKSVDEVKKSDSIIKQEKIVSDITSEYFCNICNVSVPNKDQNIKEHINGSKHNKKLIELNKDNIRSADQVSESQSNNTDISVPRVIQENELKENAELAKEVNDLSKDNQITDNKDLQTKPNNTEVAVLGETLKSKAKRKRYLKKKSCISSNSVDEKSHERNVDIISEYFCNICNVSVTNKDHDINEHINESRHKQKLNELNGFIVGSGNEISESMSNNTDISVLSVSIDKNTHNAVKSDNSENDNKSMEVKLDLPDTKQTNVSDMKTLWHFCNICNISIKTSNDNHIILHESGSRHKKKLNNLLKSHVNTVNEETSNEQSKSDLNNTISSAVTFSVDPLAHHSENITKSNKSDIVTKPVQVVISKNETNSFSKVSKTSVPEKEDFSKDYTSGSQRKANLNTSQKVTDKAIVNSEKQNIIVAPNKYQDLINFEDNAKTAVRNLSNIENKHVNTLDITSDTTNIQTLSQTQNQSLCDTSNLHNLKEIKKFMSKKNQSKSQDTVDSTSNNTGRNLPNASTLYVRNNENNVKRDEMRSTHDKLTKSKLVKNETSKKLLVKQNGRTFQNPSKVKLHQDDKLNTNCNVKSQQGVSNSSVNNSKNNVKTSTISESLKSRDKYSDVNITPEAVEFLEINSKNYIELLKTCVSKSLYVNNKNGVNKLFCMTCHVDVTYHIVDLVSHGKSNGHIIRFLNILGPNKIFKQGGTFYCGICHINGINLKKIYLHITSPSHLINSASADFFIRISKKQKIKLDISREEYNKTNEHIIQPGEKIPGEANVTFIFIKFVVKLMIWLLIALTIIVLTLHCKQIVIKLFGGFF